MKDWLIYCLRKLYLKSKQWLLNFWVMLKWTGCNDLVSLDEKLGPLKILNFLVCSCKFPNVTGRRGTLSSSNLTLQNIFIGKTLHLFTYWNSTWVCSFFPKPVVSSKVSSYTRLNFKCSIYLTEYFISGNCPQW